jgi:hypothetical protein
MPVAGGGAVTPGMRGEACSGLLGGTEEVLGPGPPLPGSPVPVSGAGVITVAGSIW